MRKRSRGLQAQRIPLAAAADGSAFSLGQNIVMYGFFKIRPSDFCPLPETAKGKYLAVIIIDFICGCAFPGMVIGTAGTDIIGFTEQDHFGIPAQFFFHGPHIFRKFTAVALSLKKGKAHAVMCSDPVYHFVVSHLFSGTDIPGSMSGK